MDKDFSEISIKGRGAAGRLLTKVPVTRITLKSHGHSTLGGRKVWFDEDVQRLNYDEHGRYLGEFNDNDQILVVLDNGDFYTTNFDLNNHYETNIKVIEKFDPNKVWTAVLFDAENNGYLYLKRFLFDAKKNKQNYLGTEGESKAELLTCQVYPRVKVTFGGGDSFRDPMEIEAEEFVGVKGFKAHGKRISTWTIEKVEELEPLRFPEPENDEEDGENEETEVEETAGEEVQSTDTEPQPKHFEDETGQLSLFPDEE
jgi:topoisomerase-4 subunit A